MSLLAYVHCLCAPKQAHRAVVSAVRAAVESLEGRTLFAAAPAGFELVGTLKAYGLNREADIYDGEHYDFSDETGTTKLPAIKLMAGQQYFFIAEGTHQIAPEREADAQFYQTSSGAWIKGGGTHLDVDGVNWWAAVAGEAHTFTKLVTRTSTEWLKVKISDSYYDDNAGYLSLKMYRKADATLPAVTMTGGEQPAKEAGPVGQSFTFVRTGDLSVDLDVRYSLAASSASIVADYTVSNENYSNAPDATERYVRIKAGESSATVLFTPVTDAVPDENEYVTATVLEPMSASDRQYMPNGTWTMAIEDIPVVWVEKRQDGSENGRTPIIFRLHRSSGVPAESRISFTLAGDALVGESSNWDPSISSDGDYSTGGLQASSGVYTVVAAPRQFVDVTLTPYYDSPEEPDETVILELQTSENHSFIIASDVLSNEAATQPAPAQASAMIKSDRIAITVPETPVQGPALTAEEKAQVTPELAKLTDEQNANREAARAFLTEFAKLKPGAYAFYEEYRVTVPIAWRPEYDNSLQLIKKSVSEFLNPYTIRLERSPQGTRATFVFRPPDFTWLPEVRRPEKIILSIGTANGQGEPDSTVLAVPPLQTGVDGGAGPGAPPAPEWKLYWIELDITQTEFSTLLFPKDAGDAHLVWSVEYKDPAGGAPLSVQTLDFAVSVAEAH